MYMNPYEMYGMYPGSETMLASAFAQPMAQDWAADQAKKDAIKEVEFKKNVEFMMDHLKNSPPEPGCIGPPATTPEEQEA